MSDYLTPDFSTNVFWTHDVPPVPALHGPPPSFVDVLIIGGGYAGLSAALTLAQSGCSVVVCEALRIGDGASSKAAGSLGNVPKAKFDFLSKFYDAATAHQIYAEAKLAREYVETLILTSDIPCDLEHGPRFIAAHSQAAFNRLRTALPEMRKTWGEVGLIEREDVAKEVGAQKFHGGIQIKDSATLQPARFHIGLARVAINAGATVLEKQRVTHLQRTPHGFSAKTPSYHFQAKSVILATNAETGSETSVGRRLRRHMTIVPAYAVVTEVLPDEVIQSVFPKRGSFSDTYTFINYMAPAGPSGRLVFSARAGRSETDLATKAARTLAYFRDYFPALKQARASHCWDGSLAVPRDWIPHVGEEDGVHFIMGCCGTGIPMSTYLGHKVALKILGHPDQKTAFARKMPALPYWPLNNWLLPVASRTLVVRDRLFR